MSSPDDDLRDRIKRRCPVKLDALLNKACSVRGRDGSCAVVGMVGGSESVILTLQFRDGEEWIAKLPWKYWKGDALPDPVKIETEVATMKFVSEKTRIPVPHVFDYSANCETTAGWPYILMSKAPGVSLRSLEWSRLTTQQQCTVMRELANILFQLSTIHFDRIGSLIISSSGYSLTGCVRRAFNTPSGSSALQIASGPFDSSEDYYRSLLSLYRAIISYPKSPSRFPFMFPLPLRRNYRTEAEFRADEAKYNDPTNLPGNYSDSDLNVAQYQRLCTELETSLSDMVDFNRTTFVLEHPDINQSNLFVTPDLTICCVIDWEYASTVPWEAFCVPPHLPGRRDPLSIELREVFVDCIRELEYSDNTNLRMFCSSDGELGLLITRDTSAQIIFSDLLTRLKPMWAYDRLVQNEAWIEFHPTVDEFLTWKLGKAWRAEFGNQPCNISVCSNLPLRP